jgi:MoxR-like ATPase
MNDANDKLERIKAEVKKAVIGKDDVLRAVLAAILARGHILIEDVPGVGKTTMALAFSKALSLRSARVQFTPDVLPTDITGFNAYNSEAKTFEYRPGAAMCNLLLADEINRTSSKTQSALLEVMEEGKVTVDGVTRELPKPFVVVATQNPVGSVGTQLLPESQLDRFMVKLTMGYPDAPGEIDMLKGKRGGAPIDSVRGVASGDELLALQAEVSGVFVDDTIYEYITGLAAETRKHPMIRLGVSPRGSIALTNMSKATAFLSGRDYVIPEDVQSVFADVCAHRIIMSPRARAGELTAADLLRDIIRSAGIVRLTSAKGKII